MKKRFVLTLSIALNVSIVCAAADADRQAKQAQLDAQCEAARERKLSPERARYIDECVSTKLKESRRECERFFSDWGAQMGERPPLYYDLPECVAAFDYRQSYRQ